MAKCFYTFLLLLFLVSSCQTVESLSIDYMVPAELSFPPELRRVGIVNNVSPLHDFSSSILNKGIKEPKDSTISYLEADSQRATESLAEAIAKGSYFDEVVICDSILRAKDIHARENTLSRTEVEELAQKLQVDFLISLDDFQVRATRYIRPVPEWNLFRGTMDTKVYPTVKIYIPKRNGPMAVISVSDSIFWEEYGHKGQVQAKLIGDSLMLKEASEFAGTIPAKFMFPYWETELRYFYSWTSSNMRDAAILVRENSWEKAFSIWEKEYEATKNSTKKMKLAHNIALYYEVSDKIDEAVTWATTALELAAKANNIDIENTKVISSEVYPDYYHAMIYLHGMEKRKTNSAKLKAQMSRFNNDL